MTRRCKIVWSVVSGRSFHDRKTTPGSSRTRVRAVRP